MLAPTAPRFLSCLRGSEHQCVAAGLGLFFLSCLRGSERAQVVSEVDYSFLSCLRGSEHGIWGDV